jgi:hypothetical protein
MSVSLSVCVCESAEVVVHVVSAAPREAERGSARAAAGQRLAAEGRGRRAADMLKRSDELLRQVGDVGWGGVGLVGGLM